MIDITKHFGEEMEVIENFCEKVGDNIDEITSYIKKTLIPKYPPKQFQYCIELDKAHNTIDVNLNVFVEEINSSKNRILGEIKRKKEKENTDTNFEEQLEEWKEQELKKIKERVVKRIKHYFNAYDIEIAYNEALKEPNMLAYSHRYGGWSHKYKDLKTTFEHNITENLKQIIKTNFGYGRSSYFFVTLIYKGIEIIPLSDWIDYRYAEFSQIKRYTRKFYFRYSTPFLDDKGERIYKVKIENEYWINALEFTKEAANLSFSDEDKFIEKYIT